VKHFHLLFNHRNESMALRFYNYLANGYNMARIYLPTYLLKLHCLAEGGVIDKNLFAFSMFDSDNDGRLNASDVASMVKNLLSCCQEHAAAPK